MKEIINECSKNTVFWLVSTSAVVSPAATSTASLFGSHKSNRFFSVE